MRSNPTKTRKLTSIPVNHMAERFGVEGIAMGRASVKEIQTFEEARYSHRDDYHLFFMLEKGTVQVEVDFQKHQVKSFSLGYTHPSQVHRVGAIKNVTASFLAITNEHIHAEYLKLLEDITPTKPLSLNKEVFAIIYDAMSLCLKVYERKKEHLYNALLRDSCNTMIALIISQYLKQSKSVENSSRPEMIAKSFKELLERNFIVKKRPAQYAQLLHISTPYLNECVRTATGSSVSIQIQQRVILEAKRLLYHSDKSVKEIASDLGYDDYPYFSRLFTKTTGMTPLNFRHKNLG